MSINRDYFSLPFVIQRKSSLMARRDKYGHLLILSKTQCPSTKTTLVSLCYPETIKFDGTQRQIWSSACFVEDSMSINQDYFCLPSLSRDNQVWWHAKTNMVICSFLETSVSCDRDYCGLYFVIWRQSSPMAYEDRHGHSISLFRDYQSPLTIQRQASPMVCRDDDGHPFLIVFFDIFVVPFCHPEKASPMACGKRPWSSVVLKIIEVSPAISRQPSLMAYGDHHGHLFYRSQGTKAFVDTPDVSYALSFGRFRWLG